MASAKPGDLDGVTAGLQSHHDGSVEAAVGQGKRADMGEGRREGSRPIGHDIESVAGAVAEVGARLRENSADVEGRGAEGGADRRMRSGLAPPLMVKPTVRVATALVTEPAWWVTVTV